MKNLRITILLSLLMSMVVNLSFAYNACIDGIYYNFSGTTAIVTHDGSYSGGYSGNIIIPESVDYEGMTYSVTEIGEYAFCDCSGITSLTIPSTVDWIGLYAFKGCTGLKNLVLQDSENVLDFEFYEIAYTEEEECPVIEVQLFEDCPIETLYMGRNFSNREEEIYYDFDGGLTEFGVMNTSAYHVMPMLASVSFGNSISYIEDWAFFGCSSLTSIIIPENVNSIGDGAFFDCSGLASVTFSESLTSIGISAFSGCSSLTSIIIPENVNSIGDGAFSDCSALTSVTIPVSVTSVGSSVFANCVNLTSVSIPESVTSIGDSAFRNCSSLTSIKIPGSATSIGDGAFYYCSGLTSIIISECVTSIGSSSFFGCNSLTSVTIPESVTFIGNNAFGGCNNLLYVYFHSSTPVTSITWPEVTVFGVPEDAVSTYKEAWLSYANRIVSLSCAHPYEIEVVAKDNASAIVETIGEENTLGVVQLKVKGTFNSYDLMVIRNKLVNLRELDLSEARVVGNRYCYYTNYYSVDNVVTGYFVPSNIVSLKLPQDITKLDDNAFYECNRLKSIKIPESVTSIGNNAFYRCISLVSAILPEGISSIPTSAFSYCSNLKYIIIPEGVTSISNYAFASCNSLTSVSFPSTLISIGVGSFQFCYNLTNIHLPSNLKSVYSNAFTGCSSLKELRLPPYIQTIQDNAFQCSNLNDVYAYMPDIVSIGQNTFATYRTATLFVPEFLYNNYYYDTQWSQFLNVRKTSLKPDDYLTLPTNSDIVFEDDDERIPDTSDGEHIDGDIGTEGGVTVEGDDPQPFDDVDQNNDGDGNSGSLIGDDDGENQGNMPVNCLHVRIKVKANKWYFFCFPFDVVISECEYPGQYVWREYDGLIRALQGANGWKNVEGDILHARQGYIFQSSKAGTLVINFVRPTFGGERPRMLVENNSSNKQHASWNFVGNPYSCYYDFQQDDYSAPITVWNGSSYQAYRPGDDEYHLKPYEAFFVQKPSGEDKIDFRPEHRETYRQSQAKQQANRVARLNQGIEASRQLINIQLLDNEGNQIDRTRVVFNEKASRDYELECDAAKFQSSSAIAQLYTLEQGVQMSINERPLQGDVRLGYSTRKSGTMSINAPRMDHPMVLIDTEMGVTHDLSLGAYDFTTKAGTNNSRFILRENGDVNGINNLMKQTGVIVGTRQGGLSIGGAEGQTVKVYTTSGALMAQHNGNGFIALERGIYVIEVDGKNAKVAVR